MTGSQRLLVALDTPEPRRARDLVERLEGAVGGVKVGLELYSSAGPGVVEALVARHVSVFVDLKLHDIPNTVAGAAAALTRVGARWLTVHASGGHDMIRAAVDACEDTAARQGSRAPTVLAVTVLTSHDDASLARVGVAGGCASAVLRLVDLARDAGAGGMVCSPLEVAAVRDRFPEATLVVPGIRPAAGGAARADRDDQARTATPASAVAAGADYLVVGRPITRADSPLDAARALAAEIDGVCGTGCA